jgi:hypothetical protein
MLLAVIGPRWLAAEDRGREEHDRSIADSGLDSALSASVSSFTY